MKVPIAATGISPARVTLSTVFISIPTAVLHQSRRMFRIRVGPEQLMFAELFPDI